MQKKFLWTSLFLVGFIFSSLSTSPTTAGRKEGAFCCEKEYEDWQEVSSYSRVPKAGGGYNTIEHYTEHTKGTTTCAAVWWRIGTFAALCGVMAILYATGVISNPPSHTAAPTTSP